MWIVSPPAPQRRVARIGRLAKAQPDDRTWRVLHRLADEARPGLRRTIMRLLEEAVATVPLDQLRALVLAGNQAQAEQLLTRIWQEVGAEGLQAELAPQLQALALQAAEATITIGTFSREDPQALTWLAAQAGERITAISRTTLVAIRGILEGFFLRGDASLLSTIEAIAAQVGLTPRQVESVVHYREGLVTAGETAKRIAALTAARIQALKRQRAEAIARTESMQAVHAGQQERWRQAVREGILDPGRLRRYFIVTPDDRLCPICRQIPGMNSDGVGLDTPFQTPLGSVMHPPAHVQCRCAVNARVE